MVRNYATRVPTRALIEQVLAQARRAPSAGYSQGVSLVVVTDPERRAQIAQLAGEAAYLERGFPAWLSRAPVHIALVCEPELYHHRYAESDKTEAVSSHSWTVPYWHVDAGACLMLLLLAAVEAGLAAGFQGIHNLAGLERLLGIPPEAQAIGLVTLGYAAPDRASGSLKRGRKPMEQFVHWEGW